MGYLSDGQSDEGDILMPRELWFVPWALYGNHGFMSDNGLFALGDLVFSLAIVWTNVKLL